MNEASVCVLVLNWNGTKDSIACLESLKRSTHANIKIVLLDNGSTPESSAPLYSWCYENFRLVVRYSREEAELGGRSGCEQDLLAALVKTESLVVVENGDNLGFSAGNNVGIEYAMRSGSTYTMLLNNDTVVDPDAIAILSTFLDEHKLYCAATPKINYFSDRDVIWNCGGDIKWYGNRKYHFADRPDAEAPSSGFQTVSFLTGCALMFDPKVTGKLSEKYFFGEEDFEFCLRQKALRNSMACCFESKIYHKVSSTVKQAEHASPGRIYLQILGRLISTREYYGKLHYALIKLIHLSYFFLFANFKYGLSIRQDARMAAQLRIDLNRTDSIDATLHKRYVNETFL